MRFDTLPRWCTWIAQDADGTWWAYEHQPNEADDAWYENEAGRCLRLGADDANARWRDSLRRAAPSDGRGD